MREMVKAQAAPTAQARETPTKNTNQQQSNLFDALGVRPDFAISQLSRNLAKDLVDGAFQNDPHGLLDDWIRCGKRMRAAVEALDRWEAAS